MTRLLKLKISHGMHGPFIPFANGNILVFESQLVSPDEFHQLLNLTSFFNYMYVSRVLLLNSYSSVNSDI